MTTPNEKSCGECDSPILERNHYFYGKTLSVRDLLQEQRYFNEKRQLVNRMIHGWGVLCGLDVSWEPTKKVFEVTKGFALDGCGRELLVGSTQKVSFPQYEQHCRCAQEKKEPVNGKYILCLSYRECKVEEVELPPLHCDEEERREFNRIREDFQLTLKPWEEGKAPEEKCFHQDKGSDVCVTRTKTDAKEKLPCHTPTLHERLCEVTKAGCPACECHDCVVLATIDVKSAGAKEQHDVEIIPVVDACSQRRLVYSNPLLFDLIHCYHGDLPHITDFSWRGAIDEKRHMTWQQFVTLIKEGLTLTFDQEIEPSSLNRHTFFVTFYHEDDGTGALVPKRIPSGTIYYSRGTPEGGCPQVQWKADQDWIHDELEAKNSEIDEGVDIEVTVLGSRVFGINGKALDGELIAGKLPTGNGVQGGDFVDWFRVEPRGVTKTAPVDF